MGKWMGKNDTTFNRGGTAVAPQEPQGDRGAAVALPPRPVRRRVVSALEGFFRSAAALSASVITPLTIQWHSEHRAFMKRSLADREYPYIWCDGVHFNVRLEEHRLCCLVIVGVRLSGTKELMALANGYRESTGLP